MSHEKIVAATLHFRVTAAVLCFRKTVYKKLMRSFIVHHKKWLDRFVMVMTNSNGPENSALWANRYPVNVLDKLPADELSNRRR